MTPETKDEEKEIVAVAEMRMTETKEEKKVDVKNAGNVDTRRNARSKISKIMKALRSLRYTGVKSVGLDANLSERARYYIKNPKVTDKRKVGNKLDDRMIEKRIKRNHKMIQNDHVPNMSMFNCGLIELAKWPIKRSECFFDFCMPVISDLKKKNEKEKKENKRGKGKEKKESKERGRKKKKYVEKDGSCKKLIPIFTLEQKLELKNNPRKSLKELSSKVNFRYVKCNPPQHYCPQCGKLNTLDETNCQFCNHLLEEEVASK
jgi:hypothetical protein